ncbi:MAG: DEAD/DEAH box helicase [Verrucomicrobiia bacterium]
METGELVWLRERREEEVAGVLEAGVARWFLGRFGQFSPAQRMAVPEVVAGRSVLVSSPTGTGKTLAAFLGVFDRLARGGDEGGVRAVYVSPLRALAYDLRKNVEGPLEELGLRVKVGVRTGDTPAGERVRQRRKPPEILLTTPESLAVLLAQEVWRRALARVEFVVVDELHALAGSKRGTHLMLLLELLEEVRVGAGFGGAVCRVGLSATMRPLEQVAAFLVGPGRGCGIAEARFEKGSVVEVLSPLRENPYPAAGYTGARLMREVAALVRSKRTTLVFCNTRGGAERVGMRLKEELPEEAARIEVHHSALDRSLRLEVEDRLKLGELKAVVCSTSLELGVDLGSVDLVVMISAPKGVARAVQRIGRSGHSMGAASHGVLVATNVIDLAECAVTARLVEEGAVEAVRIPELCWDVLAQVAVGATAVGPVAEESFYRMVRRAWPFREVEREEVERVLRYLEGGGESLEGGYAGQFGKIVRGGGCFRLRSERVGREYLLNVGTLPTEGQVRVRHGRRLIGTVDQSFVKGLVVGDVFVLGAERWKVEGVRVDEVRVKPGRGEMPTVPAWNANKMPLTSGLARAVRELRTRLEEVLQRGGDGVEWLVEEMGMSRVNARALVAQFEAQRRVSVVPTGERFVIEVFPDGVNRHVFFHALIGRGANDALARVVAWRMQSGRRSNARMTVDDYGFLLTVRAGELPEAAGWRELFRAAGWDRDLRAALGEAELVRWQFRSVAQTGLMVGREKLGGVRKGRQVQWDAELLFRVLQTHEPEHLLLEESFREATRSFLDVEGAGEFLEEVGRLDWRVVEVASVTPFSFHLFASKIRESMSLEDPAEAVERLCHAWFEQLEGEGVR